MAGGGNDVGTNYGGNVWWKEPDVPEKASWKAEDGPDGGRGAGNEGLLVAMVKDDGDKVNEWSS